MDAVELARQNAERLHLEAVSRGAAPWKPYDFAKAEARCRTIAVEKLPKGDVRLRGALGLWDPDALTVLHEDAGSDFANAFLVSHELGHIELGGSAEENVFLSADPSRPTEAAPVGQPGLVWTVPINSPR